MKKKSDKMFNEFERRICLVSLIVLGLITIVGMFTLNVVASDENLTILTEPNTINVSDPTDVLISVKCNISDNCNQGDPVEAANVSLNGAGFNYNDMTDSNGEIDVPINATSKGTISVSATKGSDTGAANIFVIKKNATTILPQLIVTANPNSIYMDVSTVINFNVVVGCPTGVEGCTDGSPVANATIHVMGEGYTYTDNNGQAIITISPSTPDIITAKVSADGYANGSVPISVKQVNSIQLNISTNNSGVDVGIPEGVTYTVTRPCGTIPGEVCGTIGAPVPVGDANITLSGVASGNGSTNSKGKAAIPVNANSPGVVTATVSKDGYLGSSMDINATMAVDFVPAKEKYYKGEIANLIFSNNGGVPIQLGSWYIKNTTTDEIVHIPSPIGNDSSGNLYPGQNITLSWDQINDNNSVNNTNNTNNTCPPGDYSAVANYSFNGVSYTLDAQFNLSRCTKIDYEPQQITSVVGQDVNFPINLTDTLRKWNTTTWYLNNIEVNNQSKVRDVASYINDSADQGVWNVTAIALDGCSQITWSWIWTVDKPSCINVQNQRNMTSFAGDKTTFTTGNLSNVSNSWNFTWYLNGVEVFNETGISSSTYVGTGSAGTSNVTAMAVLDCNQVNWTWTWTVLPRPSIRNSGNSGGGGGGGGGGSGGGGGGGGGGAISAEEFGNIIKFEKQDADLKQDTPVPYTFSTQELSIYQVLITGISNEADIGMRVEHLKNTSSLVSRIPPGNIYANENVWLESKRIKEAIIRFRINNSWITNNNIAKENIQLLRFSDGWKKLPTNITKIDNNFTYFEANSSGLSNFAVSGLPKNATHLEDQGFVGIPANVNDVTPVKTPVQNEPLIKNVPGFEILASVMASIIALLIIKRRFKKD